MSQTLYLTPAQVVKNIECLKQKLTVAEISLCILLTVYAHDFWHIFFYILFGSVYPAARCIFSVKLCLPLAYYQ